MTELLLTRFHVHEMDAATPLFLVSLTFDATLAPVRPIWRPGEKLMSAGKTQRFQ